MSTDIKIGEGKESYIRRISIHGSIQEVAAALFEKTKECDSLLNTIDEINESSVVQEKNLEIRKISLLLSGEVEKSTSLAEKNEKLKSNIISLESKVEALKDAEKEIYEKYTSGKLFKEIERQSNRVNELLELEIKRQDRMLEELQSKLNNSVSIHEMSKNKEYTDYFFIQIEELLHELNLKPGIRSSLSELLVKYKKLNSRSATEDLLSELFKKFGYLT